jgi:hypothetical protein
MFDRLPLVDECHNYKHQTVCDERIKPPHLFTEQEKIAVETCPVKLKIKYQISKYLVSQKRPFSALLNNVLKTPLFALNLAPFAVPLSKFVNLACFSF